MRWEIVKKILESTLPYSQELSTNRICKGKGNYRAFLTAYHTSCLPIAMLLFAPDCELSTWLMTCTKIIRPFSPEPLNFISNHVKLSHVCSLAGDATVIKIHPAKFQTHKSVNNYITSQIVFLWYRHYQTVTGNLIRVFPHPPFRVQCLFFEFYRK